jgi:hypothetical protein
LLSAAAAATDEVPTITLLACAVVAVCALYLPFLFARLRRLRPPPSRSLATTTTTAMTATTMKTTTTRTQLSIVIGALRAAPWALAAAHVCVLAYWLQPLLGAAAAATTDAIGDRNTYACAAYAVDAVVFVVGVLVAVIVIVCGDSDNHHSGGSGGGACVDKLFAALLLCGAAFAQSALLLLGPAASFLFVAAAEAVCALARSRLPNCIDNDDDDNDVCADDESAAGDAIDKGDGDGNCRYDCASDDDDRDNDGDVGNFSGRGGEASARPPSLVDATFVFLLALAALAATGHAPSFSSLRVDAPFVGFDSFQFYRAGAMLLAATYAAPLFAACVVMPVLVLAAPASCTPVPSGVPRVPVRVASSKTLSKSSSESTTTSSSSSSSSSSSPLPLTAALSSLTAGAAMLSLLFALRATASAANGKCFDRRSYMLAHVHASPAADVAHHILL